MRLEGLPDSQAAIRTNVSDLMGRLETGDVIRAKVLEITSSEVILRLFDGSVLKAAAGEDLQAKAGQTLSLVVTSKSEGVLYLETVKDQTQSSQIKPDILKNLLAGLNIKPSAKNLELAAEFIKSGINPTSDQFEKASSLRNDLKGINAEKAVFLVTKGISIEPLDPELFSKLLDGKIKLGMQLKELGRVLENTAGSAEKAIAAAANSTAAANPAAKTETNAGQNAAANGTNTAQSQAASKNADGNKLMPFAILSGPETQAGQQAELSQKNTGAKESSTIIGKDNDAENSANVQKAANRASFHEFSDHFSKDRLTTSPDRTAEKEQLNNTSFRVKPGAIMSEAKDPLSTAVNQSGTNSEDAALIAEKPGKGSPELFLRLKDAVRDLFIKLEPDKTHAGQDLSNAHKELNDKLDMLKSSLQSTAISGHPSGDAIAAAVNHVDDNVKLINQLNNNGVLYFQLPVSLAGTDTTAELFIMKRQQGKKKIDPNNSVMFVSLDTENLGRFESLIDVKDRNVTLNIRTEKQEINDFIKENIKYLYSGLNDCGFKLADIRYALIDSATAPVQLEQVLSKMVGTNRTKVDMRI